jgi:hypothetical protein
MAIPAPQRELNYRKWMRVLGGLILLELVTLGLGLSIGGWRWSWPPAPGSDWIVTLCILLVATIYAWLRTAARYLQHQHRRTRP